MPPQADGTRSASPDGRPPPTTGRGVYDTRAVPGGAAAFQDRARDTSAAPADAAGFGGRGHIPRDTSAAPSGVANFGAAGASPTTFRD